jgi:hypothetical protein
MPFQAFQDKSFSVQHIAFGESLPGSVHVALRSSPDMAKPHHVIAFGVQIPNNLTACHNKVDGFSIVPLKHSLAYIKRPHSHDGVLSCRTNALFTVKVYKASRAQSINRIQEMLLL